MAEEERVPGLYSADLNRHREKLDEVTAHVANYLVRTYREEGGVLKTVNPKDFPNRVLQILQDARDRQIIDPDPSFIILQLMVRSLDPIHLFEIIGRSTEIALYATGVNEDYARKVQAVLEQG